MNINIGGFTIPSPYTAPPGASQAAQNFGGALAAIQSGAQQMLSTALALKNRGVISAPAYGIKITFWYNPEQIEDSVSAEWTRTVVQGQMSPVYTFSCGGDTTKRFEILLDAHATPNPRGHVGFELDQIEMLRVPHDKAGKPIALPVLRAMPKPAMSKDVVGVPPICTIVYGGRVQKGFVSSIQITEMLHGTTLLTTGKPLPTRARVSFDFVIVEDKRLLIGEAAKTSTGTGGGAGTGEAMVAT